MSRLSAARDRGTTEVLAEAVRPWKINAGNYRPYKPMGCVDCRMTGFRGRMGIYELLTVSEAFRALVQQGVAMAPLRKQAVADGMRPLRLAGAMRAAEGLTTLEEAVSATPPLELK